MEDDQPAAAGPAGGAGRALQEADGRRPDRAGPALVLNASMEPLAVVAPRRAVVLVLSDKAEALHENGAWFRSASLAVRAPTVVRLNRYVHVPRRTRSGLSRRAVFLRDGHRCQYCGSHAEDVDHVVPKSRGGAHVWENVVAACRRCNARKQDRTPKEAGLTLAAAPKAPPPAFWLVVRAGRVDADWCPYLEPFLGRRWGRVLDRTARSA
jgi:5-methylcytosine-specific restriction endonuclease McrA